VYYEDYLAAQNGEQEEDSIAEQYKHLIQAQNGEQEEDSIAEQDEDLLQRHESDLDEDTVKFPVHQSDKQTRVLAPDPIDEPGS
jgi:hypothetical protein